VLSGNIGRAEALVERALHANPSSANAWFVSGYIRMCRGRFAEARTDYDTSERLAPYGLLSSHARLMVGACHGAQGDFAAAIETIEAASHPGPWPHIYLAGYFAEAGRIEDAQAALASLRAMAVRSLPEIAALFPLAAQPVFPRSALDLIERENE
jgi:Flp pilus assembly protein TadD